MRLGNNALGSSGASRSVRRSFLLASSLAVLALGTWTAGAYAAAPGSLDPTFGSAGATASGVGTHLFGIAAQPDGQVVAVGQAGGRILVDRFATTGHLSASYTGPFGYARGVAVQSDGKIVLAGTSGGAMFIERLTSGLAPDGSFGSGGVVTAFAGANAVAYGVAVGGDGSIAAAGSIGTINTRIGVVRLSSAGAVQFAKAVDFGPYSLAKAVAVQSDGKVVIVGTQTPLQITNAFVARFTTAGGLDTSFAGGRGAFTFSYPGTGYTALNAVTLQSNGDIVAGGVALAVQPTAVFVRATTSGALDTGFGSGGVAALPSGQNVNVISDPIGIYGIGIAAGGRIVGAGNFENTGTELDEGLWAVTSTGARETTFGSGGTVRAPAGAFEACAATVTPDGNIVTAGNTVTSLPDSTPCGASSTSAGFVARYVGFGPVPFGGGGGSALKVTLSGLKGSYKKSAIKQGLKFSLGCNQACSIQVTLSAPASVAKKLHMGKKVKRCKTVHGKKSCTTVLKYSTLTLVSQKATLGAAGKHGFVLKGKLLSRALTTSKKVSLTLTTSVTATSTHKRSKTSKTLKFS